MATLQERGDASPADQRVLKFGIVGLGVGSAMVIPSIDKFPLTEVFAAADVRPDALQHFAKRYEGRTYSSAEELCADPDVDVVWVATPNQFHCPHVVMAAEHGKHVVCEKPMALSVQEAERMVEAADKNNVQLLCGHTYSLNPGIQEMRRIIKSGELGRLTQLATWLYSDWLLKPRMPQEYDVNLGGGVVYRHGPHIVDTIRTLGGGVVRSVRAQTGAWLPERPAPGNYSAFIEFEDGTPATISYSGYGYFNTSDLAWGIGDRMYSMDEAVRVRKALRTGSLDVDQQKEDLRQATGTGGHTSASSASSTGSWFGIVIASCERGTIRQSPKGLFVYDDDGVREVEISGSHDSGATELRELHSAITRGTPLTHDGRWGMATLEVLVSIMQSGRERRELMMTHQCALRD